MDQLEILNENLKQINFKNGTYIQEAVLTETKHERSHCGIGGPQIITGHYTYHLTIHYAYNYKYISLEFNDLDEQIVFKNFDNKVFHKYIKKMIQADILKSKIIK